MIKSKIKHTNQSLFVRRFGVWLSGLCAIHCIVFPIALVFIPVAESYLHFNIVIELAIYASILILGGGLLWQDYQKHANKFPIVLFLVGFALLLIAHCISYSVVHYSIMMFGGTLLAIGQVYNIRLHKVVCHFGLE